MVTAIGKVIQRPYKIGGPISEMLVISLPLLYFKTAYELTKKDEINQEKYKELLRKYNSLEKTLN